MKIFVHILVLTVAVISCNTPNTKNTSHPSPEPSRQIFNSEFFVDDYFSYIKTINGDSIRYNYSAYVTIKGRSVNYILRNCNALLKSDTLDLLLNDEPFSHGLYNIRIQYKDDNIWCLFSENKINPGNKSTFKTIEQEIILDKLTYKFNDSLKVVGSIKVLANFDLGEDSYTDTLYIKALIKGVVK